MSPSLKNTYSFLIIVFSCCLFLSGAICAKPEPLNKINIIQKPIIFNEERIELTKKYRKEHYGEESPSIEIEPQIIVLHYTGSNTLQKAYYAFEWPVLSGRTTLKKQALSMYQLIL